MTYKTHSKPKKGNICRDNGLNFEECELFILRQNVDNIEENQNKKITNSPEVKKVLSTVENFIKNKGLISYGGQAINAVLPSYDKFYNKDLDLPDWDCYDADALKHAKELCDIFYNEGFEEVESKSGQHHGTYKVFVNFIPVLDLTYIPKDLFNTIKKDSVKINGIMYSPVNLLRMNMFLELSRPAGDVSRWEKVLKRLVLLNKNFPLNPKQCATIDFQRTMTDNSEGHEIYDTIQNALIMNGVVFFGGYAISRYAQYMPNKIRKNFEKIPDFDVLSEEPLETAEIIKERLNDIDVKNVKIITHPPIGELIASHYEIRVDKDTVAFIYEPLACHSYNILKEDGQEIKIATIDTMLSFYLAFLYANRPYYDIDRIICMSKYLFEVQERNRLAQKGLLKRFSINCIGHQETVEEMRAQKTEKFKELKDKRGSTEYEEWFLRYRPSEKNKKVDKVDKDESNTTKKKKPKKNKTKKLRFLFNMK